MEEIMIAVPGVDVGVANTAFEDPGTPVLMFLSCRVVRHPATGTIKFFGRPYAVGHSDQLE
jgi:hypothetical protein